MTKQIENSIDGIIDNDYYEVPGEVSVTEAIIYDWVAKTFGESEAEDPSWNISELAKVIDKNIHKKNYKQQHTVKYRL